MESGLLLLQRLVIEQQQEIKRIGKLSDFLVQAHFAFREHHALLYMEHHALRSCLEKRSLLSRAELVAHLQAGEEACARARSFSCLLEDTSIARVIMVSVGRPEVHRLCVLSHSCMEALLAVLAEVAAELGLKCSASCAERAQPFLRQPSAFFTDFFGPTALAAPLDRLFARMGAPAEEPRQLPRRQRPAIPKDKARHQVPRRRASLPDVWLQPALASRLSLFAGSAARRVRASCRSSGRGGAGAAGDVAMPQNVTTSPRTASQQAAGSGCSALLQDMWLDSSLADTLSHGMGPAAVRAFRTVSRGCNECMRVVHGRTLARRGVRSPTGVRRAPLACHHRPDAAGSHFLALLQDIWQYSLLADMLINAMDLSMVHKFRTLSRAGRECIRDVYTRQRSLKKRDSLASLRYPRSAPLEPLRPLEPCGDNEGTAALDLVGRGHDAENSGPLGPWPEAGQPPGRPPGPAVLAPPRQCLPLPGLAGQLEPKEGDEELRIVSPADRIRMKFGQHVKVHGLRSMARLNGTQGALVGFQPTSGRWCVRLASGESIRVRTENIELLGLPKETRRALEANATGSPIVALPDVLASAGPLADLLGLGFVRALRLSSKLCHRSVRTDSRIFLFGGFDGQWALNSVECFDTRTWTWQEVPAMAEKRHLSCVAAVGGRLYVFGGANAETLPTAQRFNPLTGAWCRLPKMCQGRLAASAAVVGNRIYILGGRNGRQALCSVESFDTISNSWRREMPMDRPRFCMSTGVLGGSIYACGGCNMGMAPREQAQANLAGVFELVLDSVERFNPQQGEWQVLSPMLQGRYDAAAACITGKLCITAGYCSHQPLSSAECFDPSFGDWQWLPSMSRCRSVFAAAEVAGQLYVCGGHDGQGPLNTVERFDPVAHKWEILPPMAHPRAAPIAVLASGCLVVCGGRNKHGALSAAERFIPETGVWEQLPPMLQRRSELQSFVVPCVRRS